MSSSKAATTVFALVVRATAGVRAGVATEKCSPDAGKYVCTAVLPVCFEEQINQPKLDPIQVRQRSPGR